MAAITTLGKYEIRRELGRGAMGVVYEGYDPLIKRIVALKTLRPEHLGGEESAEMMARFRREAEAAGRLSHPNIVPIYDFAEDGGTWYIAMELVNGRELKACFDANERFKRDDILRIMEQLLAALDYSHKQGVVHRDIKPANIFLLQDGTVKVADFGIAHLDSSSMTQAGTVIGTPSYMSPEQIMGLPVDGRSDLFSAGVILYQFLTGERPFAASASTATMQKVLKEEPLVPSSLNVNVSSAMDAVVKKALAKRPEDRFESARAFADALRAASRVEVARAPVATAIGDGDATHVTARTSAASSAVPPVRVTSAVSGTPPTRSQTAAIAVVGGAAVVAIAAVAWFAMPRDHEAGTASTRAATAAATPADTTPAVATTPPGTTAVASPSGDTSAVGSQSVTSAQTSVPVAPSAEPGTVVISALGLVDPADPRYRSDRAALDSDLRADSKSQLVEKVLVLLLERDSLAKHYDLLSHRLLTNSGSYIQTVVHEGEPQLGKNGLMSLTTQAVVNVKAVQKSLNQMSRDERIELIRAGGDPTISVRIFVRDADRTDVPAQPSAVAENLLKKRVSAFGFRTWTEEGADTTKQADFSVRGEARIKRLAMRLEASGIVVTKYALTSWTVKAVERATGEEVYFNTTLPKGPGSWSSEEEALQAIGAKIADEFSRDFFLQHVSVRGRKTILTLNGMPDAATEALIGRELLSLPAVATVRQRPGVRPPVFELQLPAAASAGDIVAADVVAPLNAKLGERCFSVAAASADEVTIAFDARCNDASILSRLETNPPAGLYRAPPSRQKSVIRNPDTLRKLAA